MKNPLFADKRIAFMGASGTGKTRLANLCVERFGLELCPVSSREVAKEMGFASPYDVDAAGQRAAFQKKLLASKVLWESFHEAFVADRTVVDNLAYHVLHDYRSVTEEEITLVADHMARYTHVFLCEIDYFWNPGDDPMRVKDRVYHRVYEGVLDAVMTELRDRGVATPVITFMTPEDFADFEGEIPESFPERIDLVEKIVLGLGDVEMMTGTPS